MKQLIILVNITFVIFLLLSSCEMGETEWSADDDDPYYTIGGAGEAGIIFYDKGYHSDGWRYLEVSPSSTQWANSIFSQTYNYGIWSTPTAVGAGNSNTTALAHALSSAGESQRPPHLCDALTYGPYYDWFLPSKDELELMYNNLHKQGLGEFASQWYSTSSIVDNGYLIYGRNFTNGNTIFLGNDFPACVRAIRAF